MEKENNEYDPDFCYDLPEEEVTMYKWSEWALDEQLKSFTHNGKKYVYDPRKLTLTESENEQYQKNIL